MYLRGWIVRTEDTVVKWPRLQRALLPAGKGCQGDGSHASVGNWVALVSSNLTPAYTEHCITLPPTLLKIKYKAIPVTGREGP
jgi:hypothetical protein